MPPPGIEVTKGGATKGRETQKKMRLVKTSRIFFCKERLKPIFLPETKIAARRAAHHLRAQRSGSQVERRSSKMSAL